MEEQGVNFVKVDPKATLPLKRLNKFGSFVLFAASDTVIEPRKRVYVSTGVAATFPPRTCARLTYLKQLVLPYCIESCAGVNNQGLLMVLLHNQGQRPFQVKCGDPIGELIYEKM